MNPTHFSQTEYKRPVLATNTLSVATIQAAVTKCVNNYAKEVLENVTAATAPPSLTWPGLIAKTLFLFSFFQYNHHHHRQRLSVSLQALQIQRNQLCWQRKYSPHTM